MYLFEDIVEWFEQNYFLYGWKFIIGLIVFVGICGYAYYVFSQI